MRRFWQPLIHFGKMYSIDCYEHGRLEPGDAPDAVLSALHAHHAHGGKKYYDLTRKGVKFKQYVGVIQVGPHSVRILPKIDQVRGESMDWYRFLVRMLLRVREIKYHLSEEALLSSQTNHILRAYLAMLLDEVEQLKHGGWLKQYRQETKNSLALKGRLDFAGQIRHNLVEAARFYTTHPAYDTRHRLHHILYATLKLFPSLTADGALLGRASRLLLELPDFPRLKVEEGLFSRLTWGRKTERYRHAIEIAKVILMQWFPDLRKGAQPMLALMFDMNRLWERYLELVLSNAMPDGWTLRAQGRYNYWNSTLGTEKVIKPDLVLRHQDGRVINLDAKWKLPNDMLPADEDIRQIFTGNRTLGGREGALIYPGHQDLFTKGTFVDMEAGSCNIVACSVVGNQGHLRDDLGSWLWKALIDHD